MGGNRGDPILFFFSSRRRHTRSDRDWSSDVCSSDLTMNNVNPDYVVVGEASSYNLDTLIKAVRLVMGGAKLIGTNPDLTDRKSVV